jgi:hypothetical protein
MAGPTETTALGNIGKHAFNVVNFVTSLRSKLSNTGPDANGQRLLRVFGTGRSNMKGPAQSRSRLAYSCHAQRKGSVSHGPQPPRRFRYQRDGRERIDAQDPAPDGHATIFNTSAISRHATRTGPSEIKRSGRDEPPPRPGSEPGLLTRSIRDAGWPRSVWAG